MKKQGGKNGHCPKKAFFSPNLFTFISTQFFNHISLNNYLHQIVQPIFPPNSSSNFSPNFSTNPFYSFSTYLDTHFSNKIILLICPHKFSTLFLIHNFRSNFIHTTFLYSCSTQFFHLIFLQYVHPTFPHNFSTKIFNQTLSPPPTNLSSIKLCLFGNRQLCPLSFICHLGKLCSLCEGYVISVTVEEYFSHILLLLKFRLLQQQQKAIFAKNISPWKLKLNRPK